VVLLVTIVVIALVFDYTNGFHDTANAIATSVSTRALSPRAAITMAAVLNMLGAFIGKKVAETVGAGIVAAGDVTLVMVLAALVGAVGWNLLTWYFGIPSSSSHALIGGLVGAAVAEGGLHTVLWRGVVDKVVIPMVGSPVIGFLVAYALMTGLLWLVRRWAPDPVNRTFRLLQPVSAAYMALSHGRNDAQKTMGVITLALFASGRLETFTIPAWVVVACALAMALGTYSGGWRIIHTLGTKVIKLDPIHGFAAETTAATVIQVASFLGMPISTTHTITTAIMGVGATRRLSAVRWGVAGNIVVAWVLTLPAAAGTAALAYLLLSRLF